MRATRGSAPAGPGTAHAKARRQPPVRGAPPPLKKRRAWTDEEMDQLDRLYRGAGADVDYQKLAEDRLLLRLWLRFRLRLRLRLRLWLRPGFSVQLRWQLKFRVRFKP